MTGVLEWPARLGPFVVANVYITPMYCPELLGRVSLFTISMFMLVFVFRL